MRRSFRCPKKHCKAVVRVLVSVLFHTPPGIREEAPKTGKVRKWPEEQMGQRQVEIGNGFCGVGGQSYRGEMSPLGEGMKRKVFLFK